jgi:hypothetical protein
MQYVIDERSTQHALRTEGGQLRTLCCGQAGQWRLLGDYSPEMPLCEFCALYMLPDLKLEGYHLPTLARLCRALDRPINDGLACLVWRLSNLSAISATLAADFMRACGYQPFQGFPLLRAKTPNLEVTRQ